MRYSILLILALVISITSCRKDFDTVPSSGKLEFSKTTVYLDTVFTNISSSTYMLKVYNRSNNDIKIPSIALGKGTSSKYRLMVDGMTGLDGPDANTIGDGKIFPNVELLAHDSLFVFIEATVGIENANPTDLLYTDEILFDSGAFQQKVNLVTLIQDAIFLYPERTPNGNGGFTYEGIPIGTTPPTLIYGFYLDPAELTFTKLKPYVIYGYAGVRPGDDLVIEKGARVHFHDQSGIIVQGSIHVNGIPSPPPPPAPLPNLLPNEVIFEGDRLEPSFAETPGQWGTILLANGSTNNSFNNLTIKNASVGLFIQNNDGTTVQIKNIQIYNSANVGILARTAKIYGQNIVINNAGQYALACTLGGTYDFVHCTFTDYWQGSSRQSPTVLLDNTLKVGNTIFEADLTANLTNCIIYGPNNLEIGLNRSSNPTILFNHQIKNCLIKFNDSNNQFGSNILYSPFLNDLTNLIGNSQNSNDPKFKDTSKNNLRIKLASAATGKANSNVPYYILKDIDNTDRTLLNGTDIGAYEHLTN